jgi:hypothetical protein
MTSEQDRPIDKISYEKPTAVDLGPTAPIVGASCADGGQYAPDGDCYLVGNIAAVGCTDTGNIPGEWCQFGDGDENNP